jgi:threonine/homoserine/homoserine lactone efflux protein
LGILLYITAVKQWQQADDPDGPPPKWMSMMRDLSIVKAFGVGVLLNVIAAKMWVFTLGTVSIIQEAEMGAVTGSFIFLVYILGAELLLLIPLLAYGVAPTQSASTLEAAGNWLEKNNRLIVITVSLIFGTLFLWNGISRLVS